MYGPAFIGIKLESPISGRESKRKKGMAMGAEYRLEGLREAGLAVETAKSGK
jgi:hypothetical protein